MPIYEYHCKKCDRTFEVVESIHDHDAAKIRCPDCKSKKIDRIWGNVFAKTSKKS